MAPPLATPMPNTAETAAVPISVNFVLDSIFVFISFVNRGLRALVAEKWRKSVEIRHKLLTFPTV